MVEPWMLVQHAAPRRAGPRRLPYNPGQWARSRTHTLETDLERFAARASAWRPVGLRLRLPDVGARIFAIAERHTGPRARLSPLALRLFTSLPRHPGAARPRDGPVFAAVRAGGWRSGSNSATRSARSRHPLGRGKCPTVCTRPARRARSGSSRRTVPGRHVRGGCRRTASSPGASALKQTARIVAQGCGQRGHNLEYLAQTVEAHGRTRRARRPPARSARRRAHRLCRC